MCRFVGFLGDKPVLLGDIIDTQENSLIKQCKSTCGINADGFGIGWYNHQVDLEPALFKSVQPAWNDMNLKALVSKVTSECFFGHIRASTVGEVTTSNCHPFSYGKWLFVHNGTISNFDKIKQKLHNHLAPEFFDAIKGNTDSEHFFYLVLDCLKKISSGMEFKHIPEAIRDAVKFVTPTAYRINMLITDGIEMLAGRLCDSKENSPLGLYYRAGEIGEIPYLRVKGMGRCAIVSSEPLWESNEWKEVPVNHLLMINNDGKCELL